MGIGRFFNKIKSGATRFFNKVSDGADRVVSGIKTGANTALGIGKQVLNGVSNVARQVGNTIAKGANIAGTITNSLANSPFGIALAPELGIANGIINGTKQIGNISKAVGGITNQNNYRGKLGTVADNVLQRASNIQNQGQQVSFQ
jgi:hypothetical protein